MFTISCKFCKNTEDIIGDDNNSCIYCDENYCSKCRELWHSETEENWMFGGLCGMANCIDCAKKYLPQTWNKSLRKIKESIDRKEKIIKIKKNIKKTEKELKTLKRTLKELEFE